MNSANCNASTTDSTKTTSATGSSDNSGISKDTGKPSSSSSPSPSDSSPSSSSSETSLHELLWLVKPCFVYDEEYSDCRSFKARFNQYYIHGETLDCSQWKSDYSNCSLWEKKKDQEALKKVIESEKKRIITRLQGHYANDVWEHRKEPPADWNKELPQEILNEYAKSFLKEKADAIKEGKEELGNVDKNIREAGMFDAEDVGRCVIA